MDFTPLRTEWDPERYKELRDRAQRMETGVTLKDPVPIHVEYFTVRVDDGGQAQFLTDIYGLDAQRISPQRARRCIPESRLARRNVGKVIERVEALERQALALGPCVPAAMMLARTLDPKRSWQERKRLKGLQKILGFAEAHANLAGYVRTEHEELMEQLEANAGVWKSSVTRRAVRVQRLLTALEALTRNTQQRCQQMFKRLSSK